MYDSTKIKKDLTNSLCDKLNASSITHTDIFNKVVPFTTDDELISGISNMPEANLRKMTEMDYSSFKTFQEVYQYWGKNGWLRFEPYVLNDEKHPSLCIRHDRYLHLFRGHKFQVSGTPSGIIEHETGSFRIDFLLQKRYVAEELWSNSTHVSMLKYAAAIDAAYVFDNFRIWFTKHPAELHSFLQACYKGYGVELKHDPSIFYTHISKETQWESDDRRIFKITSKRGILCEFSYGEQTIQVRTVKDSSRPQILTLQIPDILGDVEVIDDWDEDDIEEFVDTVRCGGNVNGSIEDVNIKMLLIMMLAFSGIRINWMGCYPIEKLGILNGTNVPGVIEVNSLNDLVNISPDEF